MTPTARRTIYIFESTHAMSNYLAEAWIRWASDAIAGRKQFTAALSGGRTPAEFYSRLSSCDQFPLWQKTFLFMADERFVPPDHPDSNDRLLRDYLINSIPIPENNVFPVPTNMDSAENAALHYEGTLQEFFRLAVGAFPRFDLVLLGIGEDGHTASLFPGHAALSESGRLAVSASVAGVKHDRVSLTLPVINNSRNVAFLASGKSKAEAVRSVIRRSADVPAARVAPADGELLFFLDHEAAKLLPIGEDYRHDGDAIVIEQGQKTSCP